MSFTKNDLELIKSKIDLAEEIGKKYKIVSKGKDLWCCCPFHKEKTPSFKINNDIGTYYCFGCGAKGDIFSLYTDLYNYTFYDAVKELANQVGINLKQNKISYTKNDKSLEIIEIATKWFEKNLETNELPRKYLNSRSISDEMINLFRIGYSFNANSSLYEFLKDLSFSDEEILKSNLVKYDKKNNLRDFFYKRLMFPISNTQGKVIAFGGRVLDNSLPKYINSPDSEYFKKRSLLYNFHNAKNTIRLKKNILICEGYLDVISLYQNNIKTSVAPLGTSFTEEQLFLCWKYSNKPTIMFDGDSSGIRASYKAAMMSLPLLKPDKLIQFVTLPRNYDPDSFVKKFSQKDLSNLLKEPTSITKYIFNISSSSIDLQNADNKISYDKFIDDLIDKIKDSKIKYFYKNEFKSLFFQKIKSYSNKDKNLKSFTKITSLQIKQKLSFYAAALNHKGIRLEILSLLENSYIIDDDDKKFINFLKNTENIKKDKNDILSTNKSSEIDIIINNCNKNNILELFPYCRPNYDENSTLKEVKESLKNLNRRLSNLKKINKSLDIFDENKTSLSWDELKKIKNDFFEEDNF